MSDDQANAKAPEDRLLDTLERLLALDTTDLPRALAAASQVIAQALGADKVDVFLPDPPARELVAVGTSDTPMGRRQHALGLHRLPLGGGGRVAHVYTTDAPYRTGRADQDPGERPDIPRDLGVRSVLAAPLDGGGPPRGVLAAASAQPDHFSAEDLRFLAVVAHWLNLITQHAALRERLQGLVTAGAAGDGLGEMAAELQRQREVPATPDGVDLPEATQARLVRWRLGQLESVAREAEATVAVVQATISLNESKLALVQEALGTVQRQVDDLQGTVARRDAALRDAAARRAELEEQLRQAAATIAVLQADLQGRPTGPARA